MHWGACFSDEREATSQRPGGHPRRGRGAEAGPEKLWGGSQSRCCPGETRSISWSQLSKERAGEGSGRATREVRALQGAQLVEVQGVQGSGRPPQAGEVR